MKFKALLVVTLLASNAAAQAPPVESIPPGDDHIEPIRKGQPAPYDGQLFDPSTALRWANWLQQYKYRLKLDVEYEQNICKVELEHKSDLLKAEETRAQRVEVDLRDRLLRSETARIQAEEALRNQSWFNSREFGIVLGVTSTVAILAIGAWALSSAQQ